jgi:DMSO/TMAO reductase YedYZ molybdopterin-dependent catalytic subunit
MDEQPAAVPGSDTEVQRRMASMSRRSFALGGVAALAGLGAWSWLRTRALEEGIPWPLRRVLQVNECLAEAYFKDTRLAPGFPLAQARMPRVNGGLGLGADFDPGRWKLRLEKPGRQPVALSLADVKALPRVQMVTELKCIEGWSDPVSWTGARLVDLAAKLRLATRRDTALDTAAPHELFSYASLETPDGGYFVGLDMKSALHPQTLLCYEMNGVPLTSDHGAPLRLVIPVKYGIKYIKRIGTIRFGDQRPADYWAQRGYDWYAGH